ncbi:hypothetical protein T11_17777 [Trichinella zimbabwensis]|uniref:Uncharacterized protein n=1 Tax=Trichinella zimbabwensis TaxID=268475 RepID=A0A0V1GTT8_9BILA|nr:hypothetical protein T11_17777 [Trichinella zimbabwensis]
MDRRLRRKLITTPCGAGGSSSTLAGATGGVSVLRGAPTRETARQTTMRYPDRLVNKSIAQDNFMINKQQAIRFERNNSAVAYLLVFFIRKSEH